MKRSSRVGISLSVLFLGACSSRSIPVSVDFEPDALAESASAVSVYVVSSCAEFTSGSVPSASSAAVSWRRGETAGPLSGALPDTFGLAAIARDAGCDVVASGCIEASSVDASIVVSVRAATGAGCSACSSGICGIASDAPIGADTPPALDAPADAGTPETSCDCVDDDLDGLVDEGCFESGGGRVRWYSVLDGDGQQALRGAAYGGDGRVYVNGWMSDGPITLCGRALTGSGALGDSFTVGLSASTGLCESVFTRSSTTSGAPSSTFATPTEGASGVWLFTPNAVASISAEMVVRSLALDPWSPFNDGQVLRHPSDAERLLIHYRMEDDTASSTLDTITYAPAGADPIAFVDGAARPVFTRAAYPSWVSFVDDERFVVVSANGAGARGTSPCAETVSGNFRVEVRTLAAPDTCAAVWGLAVPDADLREAIIQASGGFVWFLSLTQSRAYQLYVTDLLTGVSVPYALEAAMPMADTATHLARLSDGSMLVATTPTAPDRGELRRLEMVGGAVLERSMRTMGDGIVGLSVGPSDTVYASARIDSAIPICDLSTATTLPLQGGGVVVMALDF